MQQNNPNVVTWYRNQWKVGKRLRFLLSMLLRIKIKMKTLLTGETLKKLFRLPDNASALPMIAFVNAANSNLVALR